MVVLDGFSSFLDVLFLATGLLGIALAYGYLRRMGIERGEYYALLLFSVTGMMLMAQAADLIVIFLALELLSIPLYVLAAFARPRLDSEEAGLKYFLLGLCHRVRRLRHRPGLRGHRRDPVGGDRFRCGRFGLRAGGQPAAAEHRRGADPGRFRFQGGGRALPHVDAGCLPGRSHPGDRFHGGRRQGGRLCRPAAHLRDGPAGPATWTWCRCCGAWLP